MRIKSKTKRKAAFFDIDGTIFRSSFLVEVTEAMISEGLFGINSERMRRYYAQAFKRWLDRKGPYEEYIRGVVKAFEGNIKGVKMADYLRVANQVVDFHQNRIYRYTRNLIRDLHKQGYYLVAISHSPREVLEPFCLRLGFDKIYGRIHEVDLNGYCTGRTMYLDLINDKAKILERVVQHENLTLRGSVGVGDTESDIRFLRMTERPICFNPNKQLYQYAKKAGWTVVIERKDVIHQVSFKSSKRGVTKLLS